MEKTKVSIPQESEQKIQTIVYLLLDYYLYQKLKVELHSKAKKIVILLKNKTFQKNIKNIFLNKFLLIQMIILK